MTGYRADPMARAHMLLWGMYAEPWVRAHARKGVKRMLYWMSLRTPRARRARRAMVARCLAHG